jgi:integrase
MFLRGARWTGKVRGVDGKWGQLATGYLEAEKDKAETFLREAQRQFDQERERIARGDAPPAPLTLRAYVDTWLTEREALGNDWKKDRGMLTHHVLPRIGDMPITDVGMQHLAEVFRHIRTTPSPATGKPTAQRTVYNIYASVCAVFRDAKIAGHITQSPCDLTERQLGPKRDKDPEWRQEAVFTRDEASTIISTLAIPFDRRVAYGFELLAGLRPSEVAALRWRHYDAAKQPLGSLFVAVSFSSRSFRTKSTKTESVKYVPVHTTLAAMLAEWRLGGWATMMGRPPADDDLILPMPPWDAQVRSLARRDAEPFRTTYYAGRRWRDEDLPALGFRQRRHYDMRATFISLALDDGADEHILETRVTHTRKSRSAFDGYNRGRQWEVVCREVAKLILVRTRGGDVIRLPRAAVAGQRFGAALVQSPQAAATTEGDLLRRRGSNGRPGISGGSEPDLSTTEQSERAPPTSSDEGGTAPSLGAVRSACDIGLEMMVAALRRGETRP